MPTTQGLAESYWYKIPLPRQALNLSLNGHPLSQDNTDPKDRWLYKSNRSSLNAVAVDRTAQESYSEIIPPSGTYPALHDSEYRARLQ